MNLLASISSINPDKERVLKSKVLAPTFQAIVLNMLVKYYSEHNVVLCNVEDVGHDCNLTFKIKDKFKTIKVTGMTSCSKIEEFIKKHLA